MRMEIQKCFMYSYVMCMLTQLLNKKSTATIIQINQSKMCSILNRSITENINIASGADENEIWI